jgi:UPF0176 protein
MPANPASRTKRGADRARPPLLPPHAFGSNPKPCRKTRPIVVAALYHFADFGRYEAFKPELEAVCAEAGLKGTLLLASEGINGTVAGSRTGIDRLIAFLRAQPEFERLEHKESWAEDEPFLRMKVRLKKEIVSMGVPGTDPKKIVGTYVAPPTGTP